jgi:hypothetical protein
MIEVMPESQGNVIGVKFSGKITTGNMKKPSSPGLRLS